MIDGGVFFVCRERFSAPPMKSLFFIRTAVLASLLPVAVLAQDATEPDPDLPQPFDASATLNSLTNSPFTRSVNVADKLRLTGIAWFEGRPVATFFNKETNQNITVSDELNAQGMVLTEASTSENLLDSEVTLQIGGEEVTVHYGDEQLSPGAAKKGVPTTHLVKTSFTSKGVPREERSSSRSDGDHVKTSSYLGKDGKALYASLSSDARNKFKDILKAKFEKSPELSMEQKSAYAQKIFNAIKASDQKSAAPVSKKTKPSKR